jgi:hypothetical protein
MILIKRLLILILSLILLLAPISLIYCLPIEPPTGTDGISYCCQDNHPPHHHATCDYKLLCKYNHSCCNLAAQDTISYLFVLDSFPLNPIGISFHPLETTKSIYHPPRTHV